MKVPEPKFAKIYKTDGRGWFELVCRGYEEWLILRFICSMFGSVEKPFTKRFAFTFCLFVNPVFDFDEVHQYILDGVSMLNKENPSD